MGTLMPLISRLAAALVGSIAAWLAGKYGIVLDEETTTSLVAGMVGIFGIVYAVVHRLIDRKLNPGDAAASSIAKAEKAQAESPLLRSTY